MSDEMNALDVYDHEIEEILQVFYWLRERGGSIRSYDTFEREIKGRFAEIGFVVQVVWREYAIGGVKQEGALPDVTIIGRTDPSFVFDPDRQVSEVTRNVLGIPGQEGVIRTDDGGVFKQFHQEHGHSHGNGRSHDH